MNIETLDVNALLERLHRVEAVTEIMNLKSRYCAGCDDNHNDVRDRCTPRTHR